MADLEAFLVPVDHVQLLGQSLHVPIDIRDFNLATPHDDCISQVQRWLIALLNQLKVSVKSVAEALVDIPRLNLRVEQAV